MSKIKEMASDILEVIKSSNKILLHCHPYPDPDSIGSVLAMASVLKKMGKSVTPILGDSHYPESLLSLPNKEWIETKNYSQIDPNEFDLFIILDSSLPTQISQLSEVKFPEGMKTIVIDHHRTNEGFGDINLIETESSSTSEILYNLFQFWGAEIDKNTALYLFLGMYADTGGFKYPNSSPETLMIASELAKIYPNYHKFIFELTNYKKPIEIEMTALALSNLEKHFSDRFVFSLVPWEKIKKRNLSKGDAMEGLIGDTLRTVVGWDVVASLVEAEPNVVTVSLRTRDENKYDVSLIAKSVGENGGGHRGAAGTTIHAPIEEAKKKLLDEVEKILL